MKKFTVVRSKWLRGVVDGNGNTHYPVLQSSHGHMCCLGFLCKQEYPDKDIRGVPEPADLFDAFPDTADAEENELKSFWIKNQKQPIAINDSEEITDAEREEKLKKEFAAIGYEVEFVP